MIREDRELLAELARLNTDLPSLAHGSRWSWTSGSYSCWPPC